jgi:hypothetical protein
MALEAFSSPKIVAFPKLFTEELLQTWIDTFRGAVLKATEGERSHGQKWF